MSSVQKMRKNKTFTILFVSKKSCITHKTKTKQRRENKNSNCVLKQVPFFQQTGRD